MSEPELLVEQRNGVGYLRLNRPRAINALTPGMCAGIEAALTAWRTDPTVRQVEMSGAGDRGLCAGADVRALRQHILDGGDPVTPLAAEYAMNASIVGLGKPYVAHMRGIVMGGGLGVSAHGSRRLVYADSVLAMPETTIGFVPDVGMMYLLARAPGELGTHLALTGAPINARDALLVGWADEIRGRAPDSELLADREWIDTCYAGQDPVVIVHRLESHDDPRARAAGAVLRQRSPFAVAVALAAVRQAGELPDVGAVLDQDRRVAQRLLPREDFAEGVRALLVDKDRNPRWSPAQLEDVDPAQVRACLR
ncbi:MAG: enoyl-CoA hydratase/isomerase family protein [Propioniciclava sp.]